RQRDSFAAVAERYIELKAKTNRSWAETERLLRFGEPKPADTAKRRSGRPHRSDTIGPMTAWADRHVAEIRRADVADLMDAIGKRSPAVARATYAALRGLFAWCMERDLVDASPCDGFKAPPRPKARERVLADQELRQIWRASDDLGELFGPIVKLLMLTGQRRAEVAGMAWSELDLDAQIWRIPGERTKNGKAHELDLCDQAVEILKGMARTGPLVFPARGEGAARGFSATKRRLDELVHGLRAKEAAEAGVELEASAPWRLHDLRRTAATGMAGLGFPPHVVERVLNHVSNTQSGLVGVYQRHEYRQERKAASAAWGAHVGAVLSGEPPSLASNVVPIRA
ncbi:MAG: tyrosine-type recombinase/integrase, partial [Alphaproteobacteria bacterium]|nr:tyrosine-type recombinase/integrase [Alphaproteobacteria bacterium]